MGMGTYIWVQAEGDACYLALLGCQFVDDLQLGDALHVEAEDIAVEAEVDFPVALSHTSIDNL